MKVDPVRLRALDILNRVLDGQALDSLLDENLEALKLPQEKAFLAELVRGTLQWRGRYDHVIAHFVSKRPPRDPRLLNLLRLSLHQLLALDGVPPYAAIHQGGELCRKSVSPRLVGFVNGLLRNVKRAVLDGDESEDAQANSDLRVRRLRPVFEQLEADPAAWLAAWHSHPLWLVRRWIERYGLDCASEICQWNNQPVNLAFHVLAPAEPAEAAAYLAEVDCPVLLRDYGRTLVTQNRLSRVQLTGILEQRPDLIVQDPVVQEATAWLTQGLLEMEIPAGNLAGATDPDTGLSGHDLRCLDLCAAPGGKTAHLAATLPDPWRITAMDNRRGRVRLLGGTLKRIESRSVDMVLADGNNPPFAAGTFSAVLLDGPCSGTGVLRHHPDGRWRLNPETLVRNGKILGELAASAVDLLAPGGCLLYATCSLESEENEDVLDALLEGRDDLEPVIEAGSDTDLEWRRGWLPPEAGGDGFFAARLRKKY
ncbi:MAG: hypothetical protein KOO60_06670 [Gemmatimonadales bacterium]|nr:hypothetical protein [Gemmatimonadales bacterium]